MSGNDSNTIINTIINENKLLLEEDTANSDYTDSEDDESGIDGLDDFHPNSYYGDYYYQGEGDDDLYDLHATAQPKDTDNLFPVDIDASKWNKFSYNLFDKLNWNNCIVAGGSISKIHMNISEDSLLYKAADIDIYLYGTLEEKTEKLKYLLNYFKYTILIPYNNVYTLYFRGIDRYIQIVCGNFVNKYHIVKNFDYSHLEILYDGSSGWVTKNFLENMGKNKTTYNSQMKVSEYRLYKTLLLGLSVDNYTLMDTKSNILKDTSHKVLDCETEGDYFKSVMNNKDYETQLKDNYYPSNGENLFQIKEKIVAIYTQKYSTTRLLLEEIINNRDIFHTINWSYGFKKVLNGSYQTCIYKYTLNKLFHKLHTIVDATDVYELRQYKHICIATFKYYNECRLEENVFILFSKACKSGNVEIVFTLYRMFKTILLKAVEYNSVLNIHYNAYESGNWDTIQLVKGIVQLKTKRSFKISIEKINDSVCLSGNLELFKRVCDKPGFVLTSTQLLNSYSSGNINLIKYVTEMPNSKKRFFNTLNGFVKTFKNIESLTFFATRNLDMQNFLGTKTNIISVIKTKNIDMVNYILQFKKESLSYSQILGFLCYLGNVDLIKFIFETEPSLTVSNISDYEEGAFRYACKSGSLDLVKYLLELKPDINIEAINNCAIKYACSEGHLNILKYILELNPAIDLFNDTTQCEHTLATFSNLKTEFVGINMCSPFCFALKSKNMHLISYLITINPSKLPVFKNIMYIENERIKKIQNWWKNLFYDPYSEYGKLQREKSIAKLYASQ